VSVDWRGPAATAEAGAARQRQRQLARPDGDGCSRLVRPGFAVAPSWCGPAVTPVWRRRRCPRLALRDGCVVTRLGFGFWRCLCFALRCVGVTVVVCADNGLLGRIPASPWWRRWMRPCRGLPAPPWWLGWWRQPSLAAWTMRVKTYPSLERRRWRQWCHFLPEGDVEHL